MCRTELRRLGFMVVVPLALASGSVFAQDALEGKIAPSVQSITQTQDETALLNAEAARMKAKVALQTAKNELQNLVAKNQGSTEDEDDAEVLAAAPQVVMVYGSKKGTYAMLHYPSGLKADARKGDLLDGGFLVKSITQSGVTVEHKSKEYMLRTATNGAVIKKTDTRQMDGNMPGVMGGGFPPPAGFPRGGFGPDGGFAPGG